MELDNVKLTKQWIERFVIGLRLCPFAHYSFYGNTIYYELSQCSAAKDCLGDVMKVILKMNAVSQSEISNAFVLFDEILSFDFLLNLKEKINFILDKGELEGIFQIVVFHPDFQFADEDFNAHGNFINRSPLPMIHILRENEVTHAIEETEDVDQIPIRNKAILEKMEIKSISEIFNDDFMDKIAAYI